MSSCDFPYLSLHTQGTWGAASEGGGDTGMDTGMERGKHSSRKPSYKGKGLFQRDLEMQAADPGVGSPFRSF